MVGSNEEYWKQYQQEPAKGFRKSSVAVKRAKLVQSGIDPEESINFFQGFLLTLACTLAMIGILAWVFIC